MRIDEAIEYLNTAQDGFPVNNTEKYYLAIELGKEALKRIKYDRDITGSKHYVLLPGETAD